MDAFLENISGVNILEETEKRRKAVKRMVELIEDITGCIARHSSPELIGSSAVQYISSMLTDVRADVLVTHKYQEKVGEFQRKFRRVLDSFQLGLQLEVTEGVDYLGEPVEIPCG